MRLVAVDEADPAEDGEERRERHDCEEEVALAHCSVPSSADAYAALVPRLVRIHRQRRRAGVPLKGDPWKRREERRLVRDPVVQVEQRGCSFPIRACPVVGVSARSLEVAADDQRGRCMGD